MTVKIILNPYANRWKAKAKIASFESALTAVNVPFETTATEKPEHGIQLARDAVRDGYEMVIAAGGDGTINEVVNGILQATPEGPSVPFAIIPIGTANDFCTMADIPLDPAGNARMIAAAKTRQIDAGEVNGRYFINNSAVAMEPMVTLENIRMKRLSGEIRYVAALVKAIIRLKAWEMNISWDNGGYRGPAYLLSVCNGPRTGGFQMAPGALLDDGVFNIVFAPQVAKRTVLSILIRLTQGKHIDHTQVTYVPTTQLSLTSKPGTPIHADGEVFTESATAVAYRLHPGKISLVTP